MDVVKFMQELHEKEFATKENLASRASTVIAGITTLSGALAFVAINFRSVGQPLLNLVFWLLCIARRFCWPIGRVVSRSSAKRRCVSERVAHVLETVAGRSSCWISAIRRSEFHGLLDGSVRGNRRWQRRLELQAWHSPGQEQQCVTAVFCVHRNHGVGVLL
jgi:hypothetical protein